MTDRKACPNGDDDALRWFIRLRRLAGLTAADRAAIAAWMTESPENRERYAAVERAWAATDAPAARLANEERDTLARLLAGMDAKNGATVITRRSAIGTAIRQALVQLFRVATLTIAFAVLGVVMAVTYPHRLDDWSATHVTGQGERRTIALTDGSAIDLDAASAVAVALTPEQRHVTLLRGRAYFSVNRDGRPFVVSSADGEVRVLGTKFSVERHDRQTAVQVAEGEVAVRSPQGSTSRLHAGEQVNYDDSAMTVVSRTAVAVGGWRDGRLSFQDAPLSQVVTDIGRYHHARLVTWSLPNTGRRISGSFPADDPQAALDALCDVIGLKQTPIGNFFVILTQKNVANP